MGQTEEGRARMDEARRVSAEMDEARRDTSWAPPVASASRRQPESGTRCHEVLARLCETPGEWVEGHELATVRCGGSEGLRRVRELCDEYGWPIERRRHPDRKRASWLYRVPVDIVR